MPQTQDGLLLLTGGTGFVGYLSLYHALEQGWKVRAAIRANKKKEGILNAASLKSLNLSKGQLEFAVVPDITVTGAYDEAIKGVTHVLHVASPIPTQYMEGHKNAEEVFINPAVKGVTNMLEAAKSTSSVRKMVITSSVVALMSPKVWTGTEISEKLHTGDTRTENVHGPFDSPAVAYCASKIAALNATDKWIDQNKPKFDIISIHPSWVLGPSELATTKDDVMKGTSKYLVAVAQDKLKDLIGDRKLTGGGVHVDDVARVQVLALADNIKGSNKHYITSTPIEWQDISKFTGELFPNEVKQGTLSTKGDQPTAPIKFDVSNTEKDFDYTFRGLKDQVKDTVSQYLALPEAS